MRVEPEAKLRRLRKFDLWGPMWIMITLLITMLVFSRLSSEIEELFGAKPGKKHIKMRECA